MRHSYLSARRRSPSPRSLRERLRAQRGGRAAGRGQPPQVTVAAAISRKVTEFDEFTGRFEAVERVEIRPRVSGYISSVNFTDGDEVKKGDVLFVIDPRPYVAERDKARAQLAQARSQLVLAKSERERATKLLGQHAISQEEFDTRTAGNEQAQANVEAAQAALDSAALNLEFTRVTAPISGRISRALVTSGNFVASGQTPADDAGVARSDLRDLRRRRAGVPAGTASSSRAPAPTAPLTKRRANPCGRGPRRRERLSRTRACMVFVDNELDPATGTIRSRALLDNHERVFTPGLFARIRLLDSARSATRCSSTTARSAPTRPCATCWSSARATRSSTARCSSGRSSTGCAWCSRDSRPARPSS